MNVNIIGWLNRVFLINLLVNSNNHVLTWINQQQVKDDRIWWDLIWVKKINSHSPDDMKNALHMGPPDEQIQD
jgi:hypothetical protein